MPLSGVPFNQALAAGSARIHFQTSVAASELASSTRAVPASMAWEVDSSLNSGLYCRKSGSVKRSTGLWAAQLYFAFVAVLAGDVHQLGLVRLGQQFGHESGRQIEVLHLGARQGHLVGSLWPFTTAGNRWMLNATTTPDRVTGA